MTDIEMMPRFSQFPESPVYAFEIDVYMLVVPTLSQIRADGVGATAQLGSKLILFEAWEAQCQTMNLEM